MAMSSNSSSAPFQTQNSPRSRQQRRSSADSGIPSASESLACPSLSVASGISDQAEFVAFSSTKDAGKTAGASTSFARDGSTRADAQLENSENVGGVKKQAWNKPSNEAVPEVGADSCPALSESARASPKSSSLKSLSQASVSQEMAVGSLSSPKVVTSDISSPNSNKNPVFPSGQMSMKRGVGSSIRSSMQANDSLTHASPVQQRTVVEAPPPNLGKSGGFVWESSAVQRGESYEMHPYRSWIKRNNSGPLFRGDGPHHHSFGGKRDQDHGKQDWSNSHRNIGSRENHASQRRVGSRPFFRGPPPNAPFIPPPGSFVSDMIYTEMQSPVFYVPGLYPDSLRPMPMVPTSSMSYPYLHSKIVNQIDYYFSKDNLVKDTFLRQNMDGEGWVSIKLIAGFQKVMQLTSNIQLILHAIQSSSVVEVQGDKMRRKNDWSKWIMPRYENTVTSSPQSFNEPPLSKLAAQFNSVTLDGYQAAT